jgi:pyruvate/2-oxoglutarate dehydrogenase complex dihydrolipoamide acyltransferase (E2) component
VLVEVDGVPHRVSRDRGGLIRAPSPAVVVNVLVTEGQEVGVGDGLVVLEAMKMEMVIGAQFAGRVREVMVMNNVQLAPGAPMLLIEPSGEEGESASGERADFSGVVAHRDSIWSSSNHNLTELRRLVMGYDAHGDELSREIAEGENVDLDVAPDDLSLIAREDAILTTFVDLCSLFRRRSRDEDAPEEFGKYTAEEYLFTFLRDLVVRREEELPASFLTKLRRAVAHYGLDDVERGAELQEVLFRICKGNKRIDEQVAPVLGLLQSRLDKVEVLREVTGDGFLELLSRMIIETQDRYPAIHDLARELQYHYFERPTQERVTKEVLAKADATLSALTSDPQGPDRAARIAELVAVPHPLKGFLSRRLEHASHDERLIMLETMVRRYYKICDLKDFEVGSDGGLDVATGWYEYDGKKIHLIATHVLGRDLAGAIVSLKSRIEAVPASDDVVVDFYV